MSDTNTSPTTPDKELFELCKQVYEATGWTDTLQCIWNDQISQPEPSVVQYGIESKYSGYSPLYTSDYLMAKIPHNQYYKLLIDTVALSGKRVYWVQGTFDKKLVDHQDTPLKALLKLTLELHQNGAL